MGSGSSRKRYDNIKIVPKKFIGDGGNSGVWGSEDNKQAACPFTILIKNLPKEAILANGATVELKKQNSNWSLFIGLVKIIDLGELRQRQIENCFKQGFSYIGKVKINKEGKKYAELKRIST